MAQSPEYQQRWRNEQSQNFVFIWLAPSFNHNSRCTYHPSAPCFHNPVSTPPLPHITCFHRTLPFSPHEKIVQIVPLIHCEQFKQHLMDQISINMRIKYIDWNVIRCRFNCYLSPPASRRPAAPLSLRLDPPCPLPPEAVKQPRPSEGGESLPTRHASASACAAFATPVLRQSAAPAPPPLPLQEGREPRAPYKWSRRESAGGAGVKQLVGGKPYGTQHMRCDM